MGRIIMDRVLRKLPSTRRLYRVTLIVPDNGIPFIEYYQANKKKKPHKLITFSEVWSLDRKHDTGEKFAFSIYMIDKTVTFLAQDETSMNEWLGKVRELHSNLYPELTQYEAIFEANLLDKGLGKSLNLQGPYRLALCKESLDLVPLLTAAIIEQLQQQEPGLAPAAHRSASLNSAHLNLHHPAHHHHHHHHHLNALHHQSNPPPQHLHDHLHVHLPQHLPSEQRFSKRHPIVAQKTIQLARRFIRRCGHTDSNFYIETGRLATIGEGDLWFGLNKKSTARVLHELLLATLKRGASQSEDQYFSKPRSRSGSSSDTANNRSQQSRSSSLMCLNNNNNNNNNNSLVHDTGAQPSPVVHPINDNHQLSLELKSNDKLDGNQISTSNNMNAVPGADHYVQMGANGNSSSKLTSAAAAAKALANAVRNNSSQSLTSSLISTLPMFSSAGHRKAQITTSSSIKLTAADPIDEDGGYLPMA